MSAERLHDYVVTLVTTATVEVRVLAVDGEDAGRKALHLADAGMTTGQIIPNVWRVDETNAVRRTGPDGVEVNVHVNDLAEYARMRQRAIDQGDTF